VPTNRPPSLRARIGGRWAVSVPTFIVGAVLIAIGFGVQQLPPLAGDITPGYRIAGYAVQVAVLGLLLLAADRTLLRNRRMHPASPWLVTGTSAMLGVARLGALMGLNAATGHSLAPSVTALDLLVIGLLTAAPLMPVTALILATREWYSSERERLIATDIALEIDRMRATGAMEQMRRMVDDDARARLDDARGRALPVLDATRPDDDASARAAAQALLSTARGDVRTASHQLAGSASASYPRVRWREIIATSLGRNPLPERLAVLAAMVVTGPALLVVTGLGGAALALTSLAVAAFLLYPLGRRIIARRQTWAVPVSLTTAAATGVIPMAVLQVAGEYDRFLPRQIGFVVAVVVATALMSGLLTALDASDDVIAELRAITERSEIEALAAEQARRALDRDLAGYLHGTLQTRLVATAYDIEGARRRGDERAVADAIARGREALDALSPTQAEQHAGSWHQAREAITGRWMGILDITWSADDAHLKPDEAVVVADVIQECLSNALIHGQASTATITVRVALDRIALEVRDNGRGPQRGEAGMGSAVLTGAAGGDWALAGDSSGATVRAHVPR
jgi:signal transduction histidine kinase